MGHDDKPQVIVFRIAIDRDTLRDLAAIFPQGQTVLQKLISIERTLQNMPTIQETKDQIAAAVASVKDAITTAVTTETAQVSAQIQALKDQIAAGGTVSQADLDEILAGVNGIAPAATGAVDSISTGDGA